MPKAAKKTTARRRTRVDLSKLSITQLTAELARRRKAQVRGLQQKRRALMQQVQDLDREIAQLEPGAAKPVRKPVQAQAKPAAEAAEEGKRIRRSRVAVKRLESRALKALQSASVPMPIAEIAARAKVNKESLALPLRKLVAAAKAVKIGERSQTVYKAK
jgi:hypothetical protein